MWKKVLSPFFQYLFYVYIGIEKIGVFPKVLNKQFSKRLRAIYIYIYIYIYISVYEVESARQADAMFYVLCIVLAPIYYIYIYIYIYVPEVFSTLAS